MTLLELNARPWNLMASTSLLVLACGPRMIPADDEGSGTGTPTDSSTSGDDTPEQTDPPGTDTDPPPECRTDADCGAYEVCTHGSCIDPGNCSYVTLAGSPPVGCQPPPDDECYSNADCGPFEYCVDDEYGSHCLPTPVPSECSNPPGLTDSISLSAPTDGAAWDLAFTDADGDDADDLVLGNDGAVQVVLGKTKDIVVDLPHSGLGPDVHVATGDFDGDEHQDVVFGSAVGDLQVILGNGAGTYTTPTNSGHDSLPMAALDTGDIDADGRDDLVVMMPSQASVRVAWSNGDGSFTLDDAHHGVDVSGFSVFNHNESGGMEVAIVESRSVSIWSADEDGRLRGGNVFERDLPIRAIAKGDFDGDEDDDVTMLETAKTGTDAWDRISHISFPGVEPFVYSGPGILGNGTVIATGDVDGDGNDDMVRGGEHESVVVYFPALGCIAKYPTDHGAVTIAVGDFDGTGNQDIIVADGLESTILSH